MLLFLTLTHPTLRLAAMDWNSISRLIPTTTVVFSLVLILLFFGCLAVLLKKAGKLRAAQAGNAGLRGELRSSAHPLAMLHNGVHYDKAPLAEIYLAGSREMAFQLIGTDQVDKDFLTRLRGAGRIWPSQMKPVSAAMEHAVLGAGWPLESKLGTVSATLRTIPWLACAAPFFAWIEAQSGASPLPPLVFALSLIPVAVALLGTVVCQLLASTVALGVRHQSLTMKQFVLELKNLFDRAYVCHKHPLEKLPSIDGFGQPDGPTFNLPPSEATSRGAPRTPL